MQVDTLQAMFSQGCFFDPAQRLDRVDTGLGHEGDREALPLLSWMFL
jgi:hypothetical protein